MPKCIFCDQDSPAGISNCRLCGAPLPPSESEVLADDVFRQELLRLVDARQHVQAVAAYRRRTGVDLDAAKQAIEELERDRDFDVAPTDPDLEWAVIACLERGAKIEAIKLYRDKTGAGLKEAKDAVEAIEARVGLGPVPAGSRGGCLGMVLALSLIVAVVLLAR